MILLICLAYPRLFCRYYNRCKFNNKDITECKYNNPNVLFNLYQSDHLYRLISPVYDNFNLIGQYLYLVYHHQDCCCDQCNIPI